MTSAMVSLVQIQTSPSSHRHFATSSLLSTAVPEGMAQRTSNVAATGLAHEFKAPSGNWPPLPHSELKCDNGVTDSKSE